MVRPSLLTSATVEKLEGNGDGLTSVTCCNCSYICSWWWVELPSETCRAVYRNIINCI